MNEIVKESEALYYEIDECITKMLKARLDHNKEMEHEAFCQMESLMVGTMQHLSWLVGVIKEKDYDNRN